MTKNERFRKKASLLTTRALKNIRGVGKMPKGVLKALSVEDKEKIISDLRKEINDLKKHLKQ